MEPNAYQMLARIEKLESMVLRHGGGGVPGTSFAGPIVANEAAATAVPAALLPDGEQVFILSHRSIWTSDPNDARPIVVGPTSPDNNQRIARNGGGSLNRTLYSDPNWRIGITDIYIDPNNVTGVASNENRAIFYTPQAGNARQPLLTWAELRRRIGAMLYMTTGDTVNFNVNIHVISDISVFNITDTSELEIYAGLQTFPVVTGEANTIYINSVLDGVGGFTPQNPTAALGGQACQIKVGATVWAPYIGFQVFFPATGAVATILKDLGGGSARISQPVITNKASNSLTPTAVNPANGTAVQVILWCAFNPGAWKFRFAGTTNQAIGFFKTQNLTIIANTQNDLWAPENETGSNYPIVEFYECRTLRVLLNGNNVAWSGCQIAAGYQAAHNEVGGGVYGCGVVPLDNRPHIYVTGKSTHQLNRGVFDFDSYFQDCFVIVDGACQLGAFSIWDSPATGNNPNGHALLVGQSINQRVPALLALTGGTGVFGNGALGNGMQVSAGSTCVYETLPNIFGATGQFALGDDTSAIPLYDTPSYVFGRVVDAQVVTNATDVALQAATNGNLAVAANTIALVAGKTYRLSFDARGDTTSATETLDFAWVDAGTNAELIASTGRGQVSNVATNAAESFCRAEIIYKPTVNQTVKVRCVNAAIGGTTTLRQITGRYRVESLFEFPIPCTWANLALSIAANGFQDCAHNPRQSSNLVKASTLS